MANVLRLATRSRQHHRVIRLRILRVTEDGVVTPRELTDVLEAIAEGEALATVVDINGARDRATSRAQIEALNREFDAWIGRIPETAA